jgi:hypothetical protein
MAINHGSTDALENYYDYLLKHGLLTKAYKLYIKNQHLISRLVLIDNIIKLWNSSEISKKDQTFLVDFVSTLKFYQDDKVPPSLVLFSTLTKTTIDIMELHFNYSMTGLGFKEAKEDFLDRITY